MSDAPAVPADLPRRLAGIAALSVALGFGVQLLVIAAKLAAGGFVAAATIPIDVAAGVAWSTVVCLGLSVGIIAGRDRAAAGALAGALFAPLAVAAAKAANQTMSAATGIVVKQAPVSGVPLAALKSLEYATLGYLLARLAARGEDRLGPYAVTGLGVGIAFGAAALSLRLWSGAAAPAEIAAAAINEAAFPVGCAAVVYVGRMMGRAG